MKPFDTAFHRLNQGEAMIRQTGGRHDAWETTTAADVRDRLELPFRSGPSHERHDGRGIQDMTLPDDADVPRPDQSTRLAFRGEFHVKHLKLVQRIAKHFLKNRRSVQFVMHITHAHHPISQSLPPTT